MQHDDVSCIGPSKFYTLWPNYYYCLFAGGLEHYQQIVLLAQSQVSINLFEMCKCTVRSKQTLKKVTKMVIN